MRWCKISSINSNMGLSLPGPLHSLGNPGWDSEGLLSWRSIGFIGVIGCIGLAGFRGVMGFKGL